MGRYCQLRLSRYIITSPIDLHFEREILETNASSQSSCPVFYVSGLMEMPVPNSNDSYQPLSAYFMMESALNSFYHLSSYFIKALGGRCHYSHFTDGKVEAQNHKIGLPTSRSSQVSDLGPNI